MRCQKVWLGQPPKDVNQKSFEINLQCWRKIIKNESNKKFPKVKEKKPPPTTPQKKRYWEEITTVRKPERKIRTNSNQRKSVKKKEEQKENKKVAKIGGIWKKKKSKLN